MKAYHLLIISLIAGTLTYSTSFCADLKQSVSYSSYSAQALYDQLEEALSCYNTIIQHSNNAQLLTEQNFIKQQEYNLAINWFGKHIRKIIDSYTTLDDDNSIEEDRQKIFTIIKNNISLIEELNSSADIAYTLLLIYSSNAPLTHQKYRLLHQAMTNVLAQEVELLQQKRACLIHGKNQHNKNTLAPCEWRTKLIQAITPNTSWFSFRQNQNQAKLLEQAEQFPQTLYYAYRSFLTLWYNQDKQKSLYRESKESLLHELQTLSTQLFIHQTPKMEWLQKIISRLITHVIALSNNDHHLEEVQINAKNNPFLQKISIEYSHFCKEGKSTKLYNDTHWLLIQNFHSCMKSFFKFLTVEDKNNLLSQFYYLELELEQQLQNHNRSFLYSLFAGQHPLQKIFIFMHKITTACISYLQEKIDPQSSLFSTLLNGSWLLPTKIQDAASGKEGSFAMEIAHQILHSPINQSPLKALPIVSLAAPPIAIGLMHYFMPSLSKQVQQTIKKYLAKYAKTLKIEKLLQLFNNHPEIEQECRTVNPNLFSTIEKQVETITPEEGRLDSV